MMRKTIAALACAALSALWVGTVSAQDLQGRVGITGRLGAIIPAESTAHVPGGRIVVETDTGFIWGGGILYGVNDRVALELDVTEGSFDTSAWGEAELTNLSFSAQYRLRERQQMVPYAAAGIDVLIPDLPGHSVDTVLGLHLAAGVDYLLTRQVALNFEVKGIEAFEADVTAFNGANVGDLDPTQLSVTVGARFFFN